MLMLFFTKAGRKCPEEVKRIPTKYGYPMAIFTVMILSFGIDRPGQTEYAKIRQLLKEQSDHGQHCLPFRQHLLEALLLSKTA